MSTRAHDPDLKKYLDKRVTIKLNGKREVEGYLSGFDPFMNLVLNDSHEVVNGTKTNNIGIVVIRGNSINLIEGVDRL